MSAFSAARPSESVTSDCGAAAAGPPKARNASMTIRSRTALMTADPLERRWQADCTRTPLPLHLQCALSHRVGLHDLEHRRALDVVRRHETVVSGACLARSEE